MSDTLQNVCVQVATYLRALSGVRAAPDYPPDKIDPFPFVVVYPASGTWEFGVAGEKLGLHVLAVELHVARKDLPRDMQKALDFGDRVPNLLMSKLHNDNKWNGKIDAFGRITYTFGTLGWNGISTLGFKWLVEGVKLRSAIT